MSGPAIKWQLPMRRVLLALFPIVLFSIYLFGWRVAVLLALCNAAAFGIEYAFVRRWGEPVTSAIFVTATLFALSLPPAIPFWMALVGTVFGALFGKMVFGGFGRNVFNPALTGRAFIYVSFGAAMTARWTQPFRGMPGGFGRWANTAPDAITQATPGMLLKAGASEPAGWADMLSGIEPGVIGGTGAVLTLLCGLYLLWRKAASYRIVIGGIAGFLVVQTLAWLGGAARAADPLGAAASGSFLFGIFFYATDPVSACQTDPGRWIYGALVGALSSVIAVFSIWPAGTMFAVLLGNMFAPLIDMASRALRSKRQ